MIGHWTTRLFQQYKFPTICVLQSGPALKSSKLRQMALFCPLLRGRSPNYRRNIEYLSVADWKALLQVDIIKTTKF